jgi:hypothetical protein
LQTESLSPLRLALTVHMTNVETNAKPGGGFSLDCLKL